jgi:flagellar basal body-associated protein FliL
MADHAAPAAPAAHGAPIAGVAEKSKGGGLMGPIAAGVVLIGIGVGAGMYVSSMFTTVKAEAAAEAHTEEKHPEAHSGIAHLTEVSMPDLLSNVRNQAGRRFIKVSCSFWLGGENAIKTGFAAGGGGGHGGGGGGGGGADVKRILQMALEEHLRSYDIDELTGPNISLQLKKGFKDRIEKSLRELYPDLKADEEVVHRVVLTNLLVQ